MTQKTLRAIFLPVIAAGVLSASVGAIFGLEWLLYLGVTIGVFAAYFYLLAASSVYVVDGPRQVEVDSKHERIQEGPER